MDLETDIVILLSLCILLVLCAYVFTRYTIILIKLKNIQSQQEKLMKTRTDLYNSATFELLLKETLHVLKKNAQAISQPYFYTNTVSDIIRLVPEYAVVFVFAKYIDMHDLVSSRATHALLVKWYGSDYPRSPELNVSVTINTSYHQRVTHMHYILIDIEKSITIYQNNRKAIDDIISYYS